MSIQDQALPRPAYAIRTAGWFIRRAVIGLLILTLSIAGSAALLYASIDQSQDQARHLADSDLPE